MAVPDTIRLYGTAPDSIVDGPGLRFAVFVQGCTHGCPGCHNEDSQPACGGTVERIDDLVARITANGLAQGVTISGGEPFEQALACAELAHRLRERGLGVWTYSGYRYEDLTARAATAVARDAASCAAVTAAPSGFDASDDEAGVSKASGNASGPAKESEALASVDAAGARDLLAATDVLVDGPFVQALHSFELPWRGSSNQRLIDVSATQTQGRIVLWQTREDFPCKPASW
ncbi:4Fe-4S single cluster domain-containing protein [Gordonibacter sp.]|uniref:4Fe-4S single cluster domain-containing protein n=1 Tax=Gordonibacter sp. TaxID=1968902 RepID=UPI002FC76741